MLFWGAILFSWWLHSHQDSLSGYLTVSQQWQMPLELNQIKPKISSYFIFWVFIMFLMQHRKKLYYWHKLHIPMISGAGRWRQEHHRLKTSLSYIWVSSQLHLHSWHSIKRDKKNENKIVFLYAVSAPARLPTQEATGCTDYRKCHHPATQLICGQQNTLTHHVCNHHTTRHREAAL